MRLPRPRETHCIAEERIRCLRSSRIQKVSMNTRWASRLRRPYLVSAHSWRILFTQTFGGMSSMPNWSVLFEICR
jgi:hypothetical protein